MYEIMLDGRTLWYPGNTMFCVTEAVLHGELNASGYMDLTVPKQNPLYSNIESGVNIITLMKDNVRIWTGIVQDVTINFNGNKVVYAVGVLSYLLRTVQPQHNFLAVALSPDTPSITYYSTKRKIISYLLDRHNEQIEHGKKFYLGTIEPSIGDEYYELNMDFQYTLDVLKQIAGETGYYRVREAGDGNYYLDFVTIENYGKHSTQEIRFAKNLLEYKNKVSGIDICTAILPLGERLETKNPGTSVEGMDEYLRINAVNGGLDYISDPIAVAKYGLIKKFVKFEGVTDPYVLLDKARKYLEEYKTEYLDFDLTALDMSQLDSSIDNYNVGDYVHCICESLNTDVWLPVQSKDTDLLNLKNNKINLSKMPRLNTLTKAAVKLNTDPPTGNSILEDANSYADGIGEAANGYADGVGEDAKAYALEIVSAAEARIGNLIAERATIDELNVVSKMVVGKDVADLTAAEKALYDKDYNIITKVATNEVRLIGTESRVTNGEKGMYGTTLDELTDEALKDLGIIRTKKADGTYDYTFTQTNSLTNRLKNAQTGINDLNTDINDETTGLKKRISVVEGDYVKATVLSSEVAKLGYLTASDIDADTITANCIKVEDIYKEGDSKNGLTDSFNQTIIGAGFIKTATVTTNQIQAAIGQMTSVTIKALTVEGGIKVGARSMGINQLKNVGATDYVMTDNY